MARLDRPRTAYGRLLANYRRREDGARRLLEAVPPHERYALHHMTPRMFALDEAFVSGSYARSLDPEIRRLRARARRDAA